MGSLAHRITTTARYTQVNIPGTLRKTRRALAVPPFSFVWQRKLG